MVFEGFMLATGAVFAVSALAARIDFAEQSDTLGAASLLLAVLELSILCRASGGGPMGIGETAYMAIVDAGAVMLCGYWFLTRRAWWKLVLLVTFACDLVAHYAAWRGWYQGLDTRNGYILTLNVVGVVQLITVGWPGARCVARAFDNGVFTRRHSPAGLRAGAPR